MLIRFFNGLVNEYKRYTSDREGAQYQIRCNYRNYKKVKKFPPRLHEECRDFVFSISDVPNGSNLPKPRYHRKLDKQEKVEQ